MSAAPPVRPRPHGWRSRSHVSRGARLAAALALGATALLGAFVHEASRPLSWAIAGTATLGLLLLLLWRSREEDPAARDDREARLDLMREALRREAASIAARRLELEKALLAFHEWSEYPDLKHLRTADWQTPERTANDQQVATLLESESDRMLAEFTNGSYWKDRQFQSRVLLSDLLTFVEKVARIYQPGSERPLLETNLESLLKALNRASLQVILLLEEVPLIDVKDLNLRKISEGIQKAGKVFKTYEDLRPYLEPVRYLWRGGQFLLASNPLVAAGWVAGTEFFWQGGKKLGKRVMDGYLLGLLRQTLGIIAWETSAIYDRTHRYRNPGWVFAVELAHLTTELEFPREGIAAALSEIGGIPLRSSYDRVFLYRCVAQNVSPKPALFAQAGLLSPETRKEILDKLEKFRRKHATDGKGKTSQKAIAKWLAGVKQRLGCEGADPALLEAE